MKYDVTIIGSGFAGSILAMILAKHGRRVALIDAAKHPRFAIGESSTPIADMLLKRLGEKHGLRSLVELSSYGVWKSSHSVLACGMKRGFSYYVHQRGQTFRDDESHSQSLLVAASASNSLADTHWYRRDVDAFLFAGALEQGVVDFTGRRVTALELGDTSTTRLDSGESIDSEFVIDASGQAGVVARLLDSEDHTSTLATNTKFTFAHFRGVQSWSAMHSSADDPFDADAAAQHHLLDDGWMWLLRFDNGVTSVGRMISGGQEQLLPADYPSLLDLFQHATVIDPDGGPMVTSRLQRFFEPVASERCWMLPTSAATIDPLHSTGIAHALAGVDRTVDLILNGGESSLVKQYGASVKDEVRVIDQLVSMAYEALGDFERFTMACMLYFAGAIRCEERYQAGETPSQLYTSDDAEFVSLIEQARNVLASDADTDAKRRWLRDSIEPWNTAGLIDPSVKNRYAYTVTK